MSDDLNARDDRLCLEQCSIISDRFRELVVKANTIDDAPTEKKQQSQELVESVKADCKDLNDTIPGVLNELEDLVGKEEEAAGPSGPPPPPAEDN